MFATSDRNWLIHEPAEFQILRDGRMLADLEGLTSEGDFHCNAYESGIRMTTSMGCWPLFAYTQTVNTSLMYIIDFNIPPASLFNPQNPFAGTIMGLAETSKYMFVFFNCLSYAYFARGFLEECFPQETGGIAYGLAGAFADGFIWAGGDMPLVSCMTTGARPYKDGDPASLCYPNPESDMGEVEVSEFLQPTNLSIGRKLISNYCGHGRFRGGLGIGMTHLIVDPGLNLTLAAFTSTHGVGNIALGMSGGYPGMGDIVYIAHDTNMRELIDQGLPYPRDFVEIQDWLKAGKLKAGSVEIYRNSSPNIKMTDGDIFAFSASAKGGWGDPLDRDLRLVEEDLRYGWLTPDVVRTVYDAVTDEDGKVNVAESKELRQQMRKRRKERSVNARKWWEEEREMVLKKEFPEDVYNMYADCLKYGKFRGEFKGIWQLPEDYQL